MYLARIWSICIIKACASKQAFTVFRQQNLRKNKMRFFFLYCNSFDFVQLPLPYRSRSTFWKSNFSKITRQNFIVNIFSNRVNMSHSEYTFTSKFCRIVFEKFDLEIVERGREWYKNDRITVS